MAKIRKIYDETIKPDGSKTTIYPITSTRAVYTPEGETLDSYIKDGYFHGADLAGYKVVYELSELPLEETPFGYLMDSNLYVWVGTNGDTLDGKYQNCGPFKGPKGDRGQDGHNGHDGMTGLQGIQGPQGSPGLQGQKGDKGDKGDSGVNLGQVTLTTALAETTTGKALDASVAQYKIGFVDEESEVEEVSSNYYKRTEVDALIDAQRLAREQKELEQDAEIASFEDTINDVVENYKPIIINGRVTNAPDEEDITSKNNLLKLKDRSNLNGMGYCILRKDKTFAEQVVKENTIYEIRYDFDLGNGSVTVPSGCVLYFNGGSLINGIVNGGFGQYEGNGGFGRGLVYKNFVVHHGNRILVDELANVDTYSFAAACSESSNFDLATNINKAIDKVVELYGSAVVEFGKKKYCFFHSIILRDNVTLDGNGCEIYFPHMTSGVAMYQYGGFIVNRKNTRIGSDINAWITEYYGTKNLTIKNFNFFPIYTYDGNDVVADEFWFNVNSERGMIALRGANNVVLDGINVTRGSMRIFTVWCCDIDGLLYQNSYNKLENSAGTMGSAPFWSNGSSYMRNVTIKNNTFISPVDETISVYCDRNNSSLPLNGVMENIVIENNTLASNYCISLKKFGDGRVPIYIRGNRLEQYSGRSQNGYGGISLQSDSLWDISVENNIFSTNPNSVNQSYVAIPASLQLTKAKSRLNFVNNVALDDNISISDSNNNSFGEINIVGNMYFSGARTLNPESGKTLIQNNVFKYSSGFVLGSSFKSIVLVTGNSFINTGDSNVNFNIYLAQGNMIIKSNVFIKSDLTTTNSDAAGVVSENIFVSCNADLSGFASFSKLVIFHNVLQDDYYNAVFDGCAKSNLSDLYVSRFGSSFWGYDATDGCLKFKTNSRIFSIDVSE